MRPGPRTVAWKSHAGQHILPMNEWTSRWDSGYIQQTSGVGASVSTYISFVSCKLRPWGRRHLKEGSSWMQVRKFSILTQKLFFWQAFKGVCRYRIFPVTWKVLKVDAKLIFFQKGTHRIKDRRRRRLPVSPMRGVDDSPYQWCEESTTPRIGDMRSFFSKSI
jgi:hypothetical protein